MGKDEKLRTLLRGLGMVVVVGVVGCEEALAPPNGWGPIDLNPNIDPDVDTTLFVDWGTRVDSTTDCVRLKTNFPDGYGGKIAVFGLDEDEIGYNYGDPPVFSTSCDPDDGATTEATIDDNGHAFLKATWLNEDCGHRPSDSLHPADSFRFKATVKNTSVEVRSPMVVFWKRVNFEVDHLRSIQWNPDDPLGLPPWNAEVTHNLLHKRKTNPDDPSIVPESDTACYELISMKWEYGGITTTNPNWYPIGNPYEWDDFFNKSLALCAAHRSTQWDTVYLFIADEATDQPTMMGICVFNRFTEEPLMIYVFAKIVRTVLSPPNEEDYWIANGMVVAHELFHYLSGGTPDYEVPHNLECIMSTTEGAWCLDPSKYKNTYLCSECMEKMKSYIDRLYDVPLGVRPLQNHGEVLK
ncbi:MAG: hypothetical protein ABIM74_05865 [candidate division WOR-3 bacterium]